jgi:hypothetical protein
LLVIFFSGIFIYEFAATAEMPLAEGVSMNKRLSSPLLKGTNCGFNYESGFQDYAHEFFHQLLAALSRFFDQRYIGISVKPDLPISFYLMLLILLFVGTKICLAASLRGFFLPTLIKSINKIDL